MHNTATRVIAALFLLTASGAALAHPGHDISGFAAGILHPFTGLDHMLAMLAVGLWAATLGGAAMWKTPAAFVLALLVGAGLGMHGSHQPLMTPFIALSVLLLGLAVALTLRVSETTSIAMVSLFALFHGYAHGAELPETSSSDLYLLGMTLASIALHLTGLGTAHLLKHHRWVLRSTGVVIAGAGVWMVAGM